MLVRRIRDLGRRRATAARNRDSFTRGRDDVLHLVRLRPVIPLANAQGKLIIRKARVTSTRDITTSIYQSPIRGEIFIFVNFIFFFF